MPRILVSLVSEQVAPNVLLILDAEFAGVERYLFVSTAEMEEKNQVQHILTATNLPEEKVLTITVDAYDPRLIHAALAAQCSAEAGQYIVNLTCGTKMMSLGMWSYFSRPEFRAEFFYVSLGENSCRRVFPLEKAEVVPLNYRFSLSTYLTAYGISEQENPLPYQRLPELEGRLFQDHLTARQPVASEPKPVWYFPNHLEFLRTNVKKPRRPLPEVPLSVMPWTVDWLAYLNYPLQDEQAINQHELRYLISGWFEHYVRGEICEQLNLSTTAMASQIKLYRSGQPWKYSNHEFDVMFLYRNRLYIVECKTAIRRNPAQTRRIFNEALYRLAALKRDFGLNVSVALVLLTDQLRIQKGARKGQPDPRYLRRAELFDVPVIDQPLLAAGPSSWVPLLL